jgi:hypothetical protein
MHMVSKNLLILLQDLLWKKLKVVKRKASIWLLRHQEFFKEKILILIPMRPFKQRKMQQTLKNLSNSQKKRKLNLQQQEVRRRAKKELL